MVLASIAVVLAFTAPPLLPARPCLRPLRVVASAGPPPYEEAKKGFYVRPSAAVERGGGFFIPGLEGYKLRLAVALLLSAGLLLNRVLSPGEPGVSQLVSEVLGASGLSLIHI